MEKIITSIKLIEKWKRQRDFVFEACNSEARYNTMMAQAQLVLKGYASKHKVDVINACLLVCQDEESENFKLIFIAAAYELAAKNDFTEKK